MSDLYVAKIRYICREIDELEEQISRLNEQKPHSQSCMLEYNKARERKINELLQMMWRGESNVDNHKRNEAGNIT